MTGTKLAQSTFALLALTALAGCDISESLGLNRHVPDETQVVVRPPLTLPPDYNLLPPGSQTSVSDAHEAGLSMGESGKTPEQQKKEKRGFFGRVFHGDIFGDDSDDKAAAAPARPANTTPNQDINGVPVVPPTSAPSAASAPADAGPAPDINGTPVQTPPSGAQTSANTAPQPAAQPLGHSTFFGKLVHGEDVLGLDKNSPPTSPDGTREPNMFDKLYHGQDVLGLDKSAQAAPASQPTPSGQAAAPVQAAAPEQPAAAPAAAAAPSAAPAQAQTQDTRSFWQKFLNGDVHDQEIINGK